MSVPAARCGPRGVRVAGWWQAFGKVLCLGSRERCTAPVSSTPVLSDVSTTALCGALGGPCEPAAVSSAASPRTLGRMAPFPRSLELPLPESLEDDRFGIGLPEAQLVARLLSRFLAEKSTATYAGGTGQLNYLLRAYATSTGVVGGRLHPPPISGFDGDRPVPSSKTALRALGLQTADPIYEAWEEAKSSSGERDAALPARTLAAFFPPRFWPVVVALLTDGPALSAARMHTLLTALATSPLHRPRRDRQPGATKSRGYLTCHVKSYGRLMQGAVILRGREYDHSCLARWDCVPVIAVPRSAKKANARRGTVSIPRVSARLEELDAEIARALGCAPGDDYRALRHLLEAAPSPESTARALGLLKVLERRAILVVESVTSARPDALFRTLRSAVITEHEFLDGFVGPALNTNPRKSLDPDEWRMRFIPPDAMARVLAWTYYADVFGGGLDDALPLFISNTAEPAQHVGTNASQRFAGTRDSEAVCPRADNPSDGWPASAFRRMVKQACRDHGRDWLERHAVDADRYPPLVIGEHMLDHSILSDRLRYGGWDTPEEYERMTRYGAQIVWELITTTRGAARGPDRPAIDAALFRLAALEDELARERLNNAEIAAATEKNPEGQTRAALIKLVRLGNRQRQSDRTIDNLEKDIEKTKTLVSSLRTDRSKWTPLAQHEQPATSSELDTREREVLGGLAQAPATERPRACRWFLLPAEFCEIFDISTATYRRYAAGHVPITGRKARSRPWDPDRVPIDRSLGPRRPRIAVDALRPECINSESKRRAIEATLAKPPPRWSLADMSTPLRLADGRELPAAPEPLV